MHCHHEKLVIIDGEVAFVGGIDLTSLGGDRFDTSDHPMRGRLGWHDAAQPPARAPPWPTWPRTSPRAGARRPARGSRSAPPPARPARSSCRSCARSRRRSTTSCPSGDFRILEAYTRALRSARELVYLESQFLWSPQVVEILAAKLREPPERAISACSCCCPPSPTTAPTDTRGQLAVLVRADDGAGRFLAPRSRPAAAGSAGRSTCTPRSASSMTRWLTIGSANLNEHSFFNDTEMNVVTCDARARPRDPPAAVGRAPRAPARRGRGRPGRGHRRALAPDRRSSSASASNAASR